MYDYIYIRTTTRITYGSYTICDYIYIVYFPIFRQRTVRKKKIKKKKCRNKNKHILNFCNSASTSITLHHTHVCVMCFQFTEKVVFFARRKIKKKRMKWMKTVYFHSREKQTLTLYFWGTRCLKERVPCEYLFYILQNTWIPNDIFTLELGYQFFVSIMMWNVRQVAY